MDNIVKRKWFVG